MPIVRQKVPQFDAQQFTGGVAQAKVAIPWATTTQFTAVWQPAYSEWGMQNGQVVEFKTPERLRLTSSTGHLLYANVGDWILKHTDGNLEVLTQAELTARYEVVAGS